MKKLDEMITLIGNMFTDTYVAGDRKDLDSFRIAKAQREHLYDEIRELYAELESESYHREQFEVELQKAQRELEERRRTPATNEASADAEGEEDYEFQTFCDDLPFPDVEEMAPASEVEGSEE